MGISIGLVGLGAFGSNFAYLFHNHPAVDRIGLCDREPDRLAAFANDPVMQKKFNGRDAFVSFDEILKSDFDALVIITQPWLHAKQVLKALKAGKHVYSAVPIVSLPDGDEILQLCDELIAACTKTGMLYMLGETTWYRAPTMYCRRMAAEGKFGDFVYSEGQYFHDVDEKSCNLRQVNRRRFSSASGREWVSRLKQYTDSGILGGPMHYPTHSVSGPMSIMNAHAIRVSALGHVHKDNDPYFKDMSFSNETALFTMSNGSTMRICEFRNVGARSRENFSIFGTKGGFTAENTWETSTGDPIVLEEGEMRDPLPHDVEKAFSTVKTMKDIGYGDHGGSHPYLVHEFVDSVANERMPAINAWESVRFMAAGVTAHKSALAKGALLDVPDWGDAPSSGPKKR